MRNSLLILCLAPIAAHAAATCPTGYISVDMPDVEIAETCDTGYTSAGTIDDCSTGAGVCAMTISCDAGYYLKDGQCTLCEHGYYCTGDNTRKECPDDPDHPDRPLNCRGGWDSDRKSDLGLSDVSMCMNDCVPIKSAQHGNVVIKCLYNKETEKYDYKCYWSADCINRITCDAGYYWTYDGTVPNFDRSTGTCSGSDQCDCNPVGQGYYSPTQEPRRTACPTGTFSRGMTAAAASECETLCTAGATKLHVGPRTFNLYPDDTCERPAVHIGLDGGTCCAHLVPGEGEAAMNVRYNGEVYHTVN